MRKIINSIKNLFFKKEKDNKKEFFATVGYSYIMECKRNRDFRRKMEKTDFGKATKKYLIDTFGEDANTEKN
jgi:TATA-binding protein-associated factor Taf7